MEEKGKKTRLKEDKDKDKRGRTREGGKRQGREGGQGREEKTRERTRDVYSAMLLTRRYTILCSVANGGYHLRQSSSSDSSLKQSTLPSQTRLALIQPPFVQLTMPKMQSYSIWPAVS